MIYLFVFDRSHPVDHFTPLDMLSHNASFLFRTVTTAHLAARRICISASRSVVKLKHRTKLTKLWHNAWAYSVIKL